jgi:hypothetical protein
MRGTVAAAPPSGCLARIKSIHRRRRVQQLVKRRLSYGVVLWSILKVSLHMSLTSPHIKASPRYGAAVQPR